MKHPVITASHEESLAKAVDRMEQFGIGGLPVLQQGKLVGLLTSRDVRRSHPNRLVADAMSPKPVTVEKNFPLWRAYELLDKMNIERLPVLDGDNLVGIVTKSDLLLELGKHTDPLTGLQTSGFIRYIGEALLREGKELTVLLFDLDDFGQFNKEYGHVTGDKCLKVVGQVLADAISPQIDYLCRYGGDEFVIITTRLRDEAVTWAKDVISSLTQVLNSQGLPIGASVGLAGGRRQQARDYHAAALLDDMINLASLTSTRAKKEGNSLLVAV
ncbi:hypothetical protein SY88_04675 [Clostridiales bacterium PH28_bin88]|nr:hypothetical protein SY88_04675 [Clostridiales bacterium PH28_bin88]